MKDISILGPIRVLSRNLSKPYPTWNHIQNFVSASKLPDARKKKKKWNKRHTCVTEASCAIKKEDNTKSSGIINSISTLSTRQLNRQEKKMNRATFTLTLMHLC